MLHNDRYLLALTLLDIFISNDIVKSSMNEIGYEKLKQNWLIYLIRV